MCIIGEKQTFLSKDYEEFSIILCGISDDGCCFYLPFQNEEAGFNFGFQIKKCMLISIITKVNFTINPDELK